MVIQILEATIANLLQMRSSHQHTSTRRRNILRAKRAREDEVIYNRDTKQTRGFGFLTMSRVEEAEKVVEAYKRRKTAKAKESSLKKAKKERELASRNGYLPGFNDHNIF